MKKFFSIFILALIVSTTLFSCSSNNEPEVTNNINNLIGEWEQVYTDDYRPQDNGVITYSIFKDGTYKAVDRNSNNEIEEEWRGKWSFNEETMKITFTYSYDNETEYDYALVSNDYKSFTIIDDFYPFIKK